MRVRIKQRITGLINGQAWPDPGETMDLPDGVAEGMATAGHVELITEDEETAVMPGDQVETAVPVKRGPGRPRKYPRP